MKTIKSTEATDIALIRQDLQYIKNDVTEIKKKLDFEYVTKLEFDPIKKIVYGMVTTILMAVLGALISLVVLK